MQLVSAGFESARCVCRPHQNALGIGSVQPYRRHVIAFGIFRGIVPYHSHLGHRFFNDKLQRYAARPERALCPADQNRSSAGVEIVLIGKRVIRALFQLVASCNYDHVRCQRFAGVENILLIFQRHIDDVHGNVLQLHGERCSHIGISCVISISDILQRICYINLCAAAFGIVPRLYKV